MNEPKTPWPEEEKAHHLWTESQRIGHTQLALKCTACGLEFIISTWRTGADLASAFGIYGGLEPVKPRKKFKTPDGKTYRLPFAVRGAKAPHAEQVWCPECGELGRAILCNFRRVQGPICRALQQG
jgi:hypothetical protein